MSLFRDLIVGKESIPSRKEFKYSMLRGQFACIITGVAFFYILLDTFIRSKHFFAMVCTPGRDCLHYIYPKSKKILHDSHDSSIGSH